MFGAILYCTIVVALSVQHEKKWQESDRPGRRAHRRRTLHILGGSTRLRNEREVRR